jgi:hypothetical protein
MKKLRYIPNFIEQMPNDMNNYFEDKINGFRDQLPWPIANMDDMVWYWDPRMDQKGIQGQYNNFYWHKERKQFIYRGVLASSGILMPDFMVGTVCHELRHAYLAQHFPHMLLFQATRLPGLMRLQHKYMGVRAVERKANELMGLASLNDAI